MPPFGIATLSLGNARYHKLQPRLEAAAAAGYTHIDLFDECWAAYLSEHGLSTDDPWDPTEEKLAVARKLSDLVVSLGMEISCTQPLREIEGLTDPKEREAAVQKVTKRFPFMRAFRTDLVFLCANIRSGDSATSDLRTVANDLAEFGDLAREYAQRDGGPMLKIGYEGLAWARRNTWSSTWEVVRAANRENVGLVLDAFNILAVEFADPYNAHGHGRVYGTVQESMGVLRRSMAELVATVPGEKIFFYQVADAECVDPGVIRRPVDPRVPALLPWSRGYRLFPCERERRGYMPVGVVTAAVLATGYTGPVSLEVFNRSLNVEGESIPETHARRGIVGLKKLVEEAAQVEPFWKRTGKL
ncbi:xylose isomerase-like protein [Aspergillus californicus]